MRPTLRAATLTLTALTALTVLAASQPPRHVGPPLAAPLTQAHTSFQARAGDVQALTVAYGLSSNSHGPPHASAETPLATAPDLPPELQSAYWLAIHSAPASCHPEFSLLAAIGMVESGSLDGRDVDSGSRVVPALVGPALDGKGLPSVPDTDAGQMDHDPVWDRSVGPMALVPEVWRAAAVDMDGDGARDPQNVFDSAGAAMVYLCAENRDLSTTRGVKQAVLSYNNVPGYLRLVLAWKAAYDRQEDQMLTLQAVLSAVSPFPAGSQGQFSLGLSSNVLGALGESVRGSVTTGAQPSAITTVLPGPNTGPLTSTPDTGSLTSSPSASAPSPSWPPMPRPSDPTPAPNTDPTTAPPAAPTPDPTPAGSPHPGEPVPAPAAGTTPASDPAPTPDPAPTCVVPLVEVVGVDPGLTPTDMPLLCPIEIDPVDPVAAR